LHPGFCLDHRNLGEIILLSIAVRTLRKRGEPGGIARPSLFFNDVVDV
jgi:hypothetical protein